MVVYWRPGCLFCIGLIRRLHKQDIPLEGRNIWEDDEAAAFVRSVANGNEIVPTVTVGTVAMVNPCARMVFHALHGSYG